MSTKVSPWDSLNTRVVALTLLILLLGIWSLWYYLSRSLQADMERLLGEQQMSAVTVVAQEVNGELTQRLQALETMAKDTDAGLLKRPVALQSRLEQQALLQLLFNGGIWVADAGGTVIADVPFSTQRIGVNYGDMEFIAAALQQGRSAIGQPLMAKPLKAPIFDMAVPLRDAQGKVIGAVVGVTNLGALSFLDKITQNPYGKTGGYVLAAVQSRRVVTATDSRRILEALPAKGVNLWVDRFAEGYEGWAVARNVKGVEVLVSGKGVPVADWVLVATLPAEEAFAPLHDLQRRLLWVTLFLTVLTGALIWWVLKRQLAPLVETAGSMAALAESAQLPQPLALTVKGEIGQLVDGFNRILQTWTLREAALQKSEQNLAITLNSIGDGVIATDTTGRITAMNPAAEALTGWTLAEAQGRVLDQVFHLINAQTRQPVLNPVQLVLEHGDVVGMASHTTLLARGGGEHQIADSASPILNASSAIVGVVLVFSDVSEQYRVELALKTSEQQYRSLLENLSSGVVVHRPDTSISLCNTMAAALLGLTQDQMLGKTAPDPDWCFLAEDGTPLPLVHYPVNLVLDSHVPLRNYVVGVHHPGGALPTWAICNAYPMWDDEGKLLQVVVTFTDITERKLAEAKLQLAASVFAHAREGITITDTHGTIVDINEAFTRVSGYSREEAIGQNPRILSSGRQDKAFYAAMWSALNLQGHWSGEIWNRRKNGEVYAELLTISAVRNAQGVTQQYVALFSDITTIKEHQRQLEHIAHFDALTGLPNRLLLADRLQQAMVHAQRRGQQVAVAYLDLDGFKSVNDRYGHDVGDQLLIQLARAMKETLREGDTLARIGGDEFVAVLIDLEGIESCVPLLTRLLEAAASPVPLSHGVMQGSVSIGVTFYPQEHEVEADQLLRQADQSMYQAKLSGKNRYHLFDAAQDSSMRVHHESLERIRLALANGEFVLHYQPKVNMRSGRVIGAEALIRWQHPEKGLLAPATFLPVIEDHPLAVEVGEWVIHTALTQIARWHASGLDLAVSVNIGARQLQQGDFVARLQTILTMHPHVNPASLELEVLETSALADMEQVSLVIEDCARIGVNFALDDFGTGYSSLTYLKRLRVALLKIDQSFVRDMLDDPDDLAILEGVIGLAAAFKRAVIAEGVETVAHGTALLHLGCEMAQGYGIARPMPADQLPEWVASWQPDAAWSELPRLDGVVALDS
jgi:diguanylate cyclase (GGDEF)-like protein/PAS domain S-box-containing protein